MSTRLHIQNDYPPDWDEIGDRVRAEAGHRCIRCGHPYKTGEHGKGEWTPCDERCSHLGPIGVLFPADHTDTTITDRVQRLAPRLACEAVKERNRNGVVVVAEWRILTVHHLDGDKANCEWWNLLALCQRCHLQIQTRLNPQIPYFLEHSDWFKPYVAGFYAHKYEGRNITRSEAIERMDELLALERLA